LMPVISQQTLQRCLYLQACGKPNKIDHTYSTYFGGFRNLNIRVHHLVSHLEKYWSHVYSESIMITQYKNWKTRPFCPNPIPITPVTTQREVDISDIFYRGHFHSKSPVLGFYPHKII
jgi:hypothetical protein